MSLKVALENQNVVETRRRKLGILATNDPRELKDDIPNFLSMGLSSFPPMISMVESFHASQVVYDFQASKVKFIQIHQVEMMRRRLQAWLLQAGIPEWMKVCFFAQAV